MTSNFDFLKDTFPVLSNLGGLAEKYVYSDPNGALMKLGMLGETIVNLMFTYDDIPVPEDSTAATRIDILQREGLLSRDLSDILHVIRKRRNKAIHENYGTANDSRPLLEMAYSLSEWFMQTYGDWTYEHRPFQPPKVTKKSLTGAEERNREDREAEELAKDAEKVARQTEKVSKAERKKQAVRSANQREKSEAETRYMVDEQLRQVGWEADTEELRHGKGVRPEKGRNLAIAEWPTESETGDRGYADYALFVGTKLVGIIEAKAAYKDISSVIDYQGREYGRNIREEDEKYTVGTWGEYRVPFIFATNGRPYLEQYKTMSGIWTLDLRDPANIPKALKGWPGPEGLAEKLEKDIEEGNRALREMPFDLLRDPDGLNLRDYQLEAVKAAEDAIIRGQKNVLLAMATGTGKTRTVLGMIYRFLKTERFRRILYLVDRTSLGEQAMDVFEEVKLEDLMTLDEIYNIQGLEDKFPEKETRIHVATVQGMVRRILYPEGERMPAVTDYDLIVIDEAHRGYILDKEMTEGESLFRDQRDYQSKYRSVIDYFDGVKVAMTATPALHTTEIFGPPVYRYTYRQAVIEGYLVDHDAPHVLKTKLNTEGLHFDKGQTVTVYDPVTGELINDAELTDDLDFEVEDFNRKVITESFNRTVLEEIAKNIDPENPMEGKTLIYAVSDKHADMIVDILRNIYRRYDVSSEAIMKITGSVGGGDPKRVREAIKRFKNEKYPSIAVTVDLLTTGIDVPEITVLVFLRQVKSRILFEQMMGRATRLCPKIKKTHFEIYDPVRLYENLGPVTNMPPVTANPKKRFTKMLEELSATDEDRLIREQITEIIGKLQRKKRVLSGKDIETFILLSGGQDPDEFIEELLGLPPKEGKKRLEGTGELMEFLDGHKTDGAGKVLISDAPDRLTEHQRGYGKGEKPEDYIRAFSEYVTENVDEIGAMKIIVTRPRDLTREGLKKLRLQLDHEGFTEKQLNTAISEVTNREIVMDIISLIRRYAIGSPLISHEDRVRQAVDKLKAAHDFSKVELNWIDRMEKYMLEESILNVRVFDEDSRFKNYGGFKKLNKVFQNKLKNIVKELNEYLYDDEGRTA